jgi:hypothetical protein
LRKILALSVLILLLVSSFFAASAVKPDPLELLIKTDNASLQRKALHQIVMNKAVYSKEVAQIINSFYKRKGSYNELEKLLYVAALIKCKEAVPVLEKIWLDQISFENDCIYCCPRSLVMTVLDLHGVWKPPKLSDAQRRTDQVENTLEELKRCENGSLEIEAQNGLIPQGTDDYGILARQYSSFQDDKLLEIVTNSKDTYQQRYAASIELRIRAIDDHLLVDFYWWALNACDDDSGECLCFAHESILSAELYSSRHKH